MAGTSDKGSEMKDVDYFLKSDAVETEHEKWIGQHIGYRYDVNLVPDYERAKTYVETMGWDDLNWLEDVHMGYEEGRPAVFDRNINGWVSAPWCSPHALELLRCTGLSSGGVDLVASAGAAAGLGPALRCFYRLVVPMGCRGTTRPRHSRVQAIPHRQGSLWRTEKRALSAVWESSCRAESPRPAGVARLAGLGTTTAGGALDGSLSGHKHFDYRPVVKRVNYRRRNTKAQGTGKNLRALALLPHEG